MITQANDLLVLSCRDTVELGKAVEQRFLDLCGTYMRIKGCGLELPSSLDSAMFLWRRMRVRHKRGDFRHSRSELLATREVAQWTLSENCKLRNQPDKVIQWKD